MRTLHAEFHLGGIGRAVPADKSVHSQSALLMEYRADTGRGRDRARGRWPELQGHALGAYPVLGQGREDRQSAHQREGGDGCRETGLPGGLQGTPLPHPRLRVLRMESHPQPRQGQAPEAAFLHHPIRRLANDLCGAIGEMERRPSELRDPHNRRWRHYTGYSRPHAAHARSGRDRQMAWGRGAGALGDR